MLPRTCVPYLPFLWKGMCEIEPGLAKSFGHPVPFYIPGADHEEFVALFNRFFAEELTQEQRTTAFALPEAVTCIVGPYISCMVDFFDRESGWGTPRMFWDLSIKAEAPDHFALTLVDAKSLSAEGDEAIYDYSVHQTSSFKVLGEHQVEHVGSIHYKEDMLDKPEVQQAHDLFKQHLTQHIDLVCFINTYRDRFQLTHDPQVGIHYGFK